MKNNLLIIALATTVLLIDGVQASEELAKKMAVSCATD